MIENFHNLEVFEALKALGSSKKGLNKKEVTSRQEKYGPNTLIEKKKESNFSKFISNFRSSLVYILLVAGIFTLFVGKTLDATVIFTVILLNAVIGYIQEKKAEDALEALKKLTTSEVTVIRDGKEKEIFKKELVPGDIVILEQGDKVPADGRLIYAKELRVDESSLTGESVSQGKTSSKIKYTKDLLNKKNMVFMGTIVVTGRALVLVVRTGMNTEFGKIAELYEDELDKETAIQVKLKRLSRWIGVFVIFISLIVFLSGMYIGNSLIYMAQFSIGLAVSAIPEGLPVAITVILVFGVYRMAQRKAIIRKLLAVETLGTVSVIASDKTGTLTHNKLRVTHIYTCKEEEIKSSDDFGGTIKAQRLKKGKDGDHLLYLLNIAAVCNNSRLYKAGGDYKIKGMPTEGALLFVARKFGIDKESIDNTYIREDEIPFTSDRKYMATLNDTGDRKVIFIKGAAERLIEKCKYKFISSDKKIPFTKKDKEHYKDIAEKWADEGLRVLSFCYKDTDSGKEEIKEKDIGKDLVFVGLTAMIDSYREEAAVALKKAKEAGIKVIMLTGDHLNTARKIAKDLKIIKTNDQAMDATGLGAIRGEKLEEVVANTYVYARITPEHKYKIISKLQDRGEVVAMTGDGINDVPALAKADVGIAMGITGTEAAKEASDVILSDDNFATIVRAVEGGRTVFENIKKVLLYLLSTNLGEVITIFFSLIFFLPFPVTPIQILWVNLVTDSASTIPLGIEPKEEGHLKKPPRKKTENIISRLIKFRVILTALVIAAGTLYVYIVSLDGGLEYARTMAFTTLVVFQWMNAFNARSEKRSVFAMNPFGNVYILLGIFVAFLLQLLVIYQPFMQKAFSTVALSLDDWIRVLLISLSVILVIEIEKLLRRISEKSELKKVKLKEKTV